MNFKYTLIIFCIAGLFSACNKDDDSTPGIAHETGPCLAEASPINFVTGNCPQFSDTTFFCENIVLDEYFLLNDAQKDWIPIFCCEIGNELVFINNDNDRTKLSVISKSNTISTSGMSGGDICQSDPDKQNFYCVNNEVASISLSSDLLDLTLQVSLELEFQRPFTDTLKTGASVNITTLKFDGGNIEFINHFRAIVDEGELDDIIISNEEFYEEITILGETYFDVFSFTNSFDPKAIKMFYNKEFGIVSFIDTDGVQWRLK